jgi:predicted MFS family arabinose efflux permease
MDARSLARHLLPLYIVIFIGFVGYSLMITVFTPMVMQNTNGILPLSTSLSVRLVLLGILLSLYPLGQFFGSSIIGALSDRFGRKRLLLSTLALTAICYLFIMLALHERNFILLMIFSLIAGLSEANIAIAQSAIADVTTEKNRTHYFGYIYLSASSAYIVGPLLGGKLAAFRSDAYPFAVVAVMLFLTFFWTFLSFKEGKITSRSKANYLQAFTNILQVFKDRKLRFLYGVNFLLYLAIFGFFRCYPMYLVDEFHLSVSKLSEFIAWVAVPIIITNLGLTRFLAAKLSPRRMTVYSALVTGLGMILIILPTSVNALWGTLFVTSLALALCLPSCASMLSLAASQDKQGGVMGNNQSLQVGAEALSGVIGGLLAAVFIKLSLIVLGMIALLAVVLVLNKK